MSRLKNLQAARQYLLFSPAVLIDSMLAAPPLFPRRPMKEKDFW